MSYYSEKRPKRKTKSPAPPAAPKRADEFPFARESPQAPLHPKARNRTPR